MLKINERGITTRANGPSVFDLDLKIDQLRQEQKRVKQRLHKGELK
jgi:hypothetical protein